MNEPTLKQRLGSSKEVLRLAQHCNPANLKPFKYKGRLVAVTSAAWSEHGRASFVRLLMLRDVTGHVFKKSVDQIKVNGHGVIPESRWKKWIAHDQTLGKEGLPRGNMQGCVIETGKRKYRIASEVFISVK